MIGGIMGFMRQAVLRIFTKYRPDQPRVPAGRSDGGRWTDDSGTVRIKLRGASPEEGQAALDAAEEILDAGFRSPFEHGLTVLKFGEGEYVQLGLRASHQKGMIHLSALKVPSESQRKGYGTKVMEMVTGIADRHKVPLSLFAVPYTGEIPQPKLIKWYERFGFEVESGAYMVRRPRIAKYRPDQPRAPKGSPIGGQWIEEFGRVSMGLLTQAEGWFARKTGKDEITPEDAEKIAEIAAKEVGVEITGEYFGEGGWTNPETGKYEGEPSSVWVVDGTPEQVGRFAAISGYLGGQYSMLTVTNATRETADSIALNITTPDGRFPESELYRLARSIDPERFGGFSALKTADGVGISIITEMGDEKNVAAVRSAAEKIRSEFSGQGISINAQFVRAEFVTGGNDGAGYIERLASLRPEGGADTGWLGRLESEAAAALGVLEKRLILWKYSPDQPRVPKGHPDGGQWTDADGGNKWLLLADPNNPRYDAGIEEGDSFEEKERKIAEVASRIKEDFGVDVLANRTVLFTHDHPLGGTRTQEEMAVAAAELGGALAEWKATMQARGFDVEKMDLSSVRVSLQRPGTMMDNHEWEEMGDGLVGGLYNHQFQSVHFLTSNEVAEYVGEVMAMDAKVRAAGGRLYAYKDGYDPVSWVRSTIRHEIGHAIDDRTWRRMGGPASIQLFNPGMPYDPAWVWSNISVYGSTSPDEAWAESFSMQTAPGYDGSLGEDFDSMLRIVLFNEGVS